MDGFGTWTLYRSKYIFNYRIALVILFLSFAEKAADAPMYVYLLNIWSTQ